MKIEEIILAKKLAGGSSPSVDIEQLNVTENGTYSEEGKAYSPVIVEVPEPTLISKSITANGTYNASEDNADGYSSVTVTVDGFKKKSIANTPTDIASFNDGTANPMPSLEISIVPVQSGSGDPSPQNRRPISGWSGCNVIRTGKNLLPNTFSSYSINNNYAFMNGIVPNGETARFTFTDKDTSVDISGCYIGFQKGLSEQVQTISDTYRWVINNGAVQTNKSNISDTNVVCDGVMIYPRNQTTFDKLFARYDIMVELGSTATTYSPYQGSTLSIPFKDSQGNPVEVYGGSVDVVNGGEQPSAKAKIDLYTLDWTYQSNNSRFYVASPSNLLKPSDNAQAFKGLCSAYLVSPYAEHGDKAIAVTTTGSMFIFDTDYTDATALKTFLQNNNVHLVYEIATPNTFYTQPTAITPLDGDNNLRADCGQILQGEYFVTL